MKKYSFAPYNNGKGKGICPRCRKKSLSLLIDDETSELFPTNFGYCDHINKCGYSCFPEGNRPISDFYYQEIQKPKPKILSTEYLKHQKLFKNEWATMRRNEPCNFTRYLITVFGSTICHKVLDAYKITSTKDGGTVFWQIDKHGHIHSGKIMYYAPNGKNTGRINWVHSRLIKRKLLPSEFVLNQCLFGEHLLGKNSDAPITINLVEGQSTALYLAAKAMNSNGENDVFLATGGKSGTSLANIGNGLRGHDVTLFPDAGYYKAWAKLANQLLRYDVEANVSSELESMYRQGIVNKNDDLRDYYHSLKEKGAGQLDKPFIKITSLFNIF